MAKKVTIQTLRSYKAEGRRIVMVTCYDATFMRILDAAGVDVVLVGDSLGMVIQGRDTTIKVSMDDMIYHGSIVARGVSRAHLTVDLPFLSYQVSDEQALQNAARLMQEGGAESVKLEGGRERARSIQKIVNAGIPVMGHIGLTPQSFHAMGGFKVQGKTPEHAARLKDDALALQDAGCFGLVLEGIPADLAGQISQSLEIPTIGIGAGPHCDGQVLVIYDLLGMDNSFNPKFAKRYANLQQSITDAVQSYSEEVREGVFPGPEHSF